MAKLLHHFNHEAFPFEFFLFWWRAKRPLFFKVNEKKDRKKKRGLFALLQKPFLLQIYNYSLYIKTNPYFLLFAHFFFCFSVHIPIAFSLVSVSYPTTRMKNKLQLDDVIGDERLSSAFLTFLKASYMSVSYELWLEIVKYETECKNDSQRRDVYRGVMKRFFEKGCPDPMSLPKLITHSITKYYVDIDDESKKLPKGLFNQSKEELWMLLCWTCLPAFQLSETYKDFETGKIDSVKTGQSRVKAERFFGQTITGPLERTELVTYYGTRNATYGEQKLRLKAELDYQKDKKMDMVDVMKQARKGGLFERIDLDVIAERKGMGSEGSSKGSDKGSSNSKSKSKYTKSSSSKKKKIKKFHPVFGEIEVEVSDEEGELLDDLGTSNTDLTIHDCNPLEAKEKEKKPGGEGQAVGLWEMFE